MLVPQKYTFKRMIRQTMENVQQICNCQHCGKEIINLCFIEGTEDKKEYVVGCRCVEKLLAMDELDLGDTVYDYREEMTMWKNAMSALKTLKKYIKEYETNWPGTTIVARYNCKDDFGIAIFRKTQFDEKKFNESNWCVTQTIICTTYFPNKVKDLFNDIVQYEGGKNERIY